MEFLEALSKLPGALLDVRFMRSDFRGTEQSQQVTSIGGRVLKSLGLPGLNRDEFRVHPEGLCEVWRSQHDIYVLSGLYTSPTFQLCALILALRRKPIVFWLERPSEAMRSDLSLLLKVIRLPFFFARKLLFWWMFRICTGVIAIGSLAAQQYVASGALKERMASVPYCCNSSRFRGDNTRSRQQIRENFGITEKVVFLFSGQLIPRKGADLLLSAFADVRNGMAEVVLLVIGDGAQRRELEMQAQQLPPHSVIFAGYRDQSELPGIFAAADVFVFPSRYDGWAVVINEACAAGFLCWHPVLRGQRTTW